MSTFPADFMIFKQCLDNFLGITKTIFKFNLTKYFLIFWVLNAFSTVDHGLSYLALDKIKSNKNKQINRDQMPLAALIQVLFWTSAPVVVEWK